VLRCLPLAVLAGGLLHAAEPAKKFTYKQTDRGGLQLHVFLPAGHQPGDRTSAIVFFFGGGWVSGHPGQFYPQCAYLASRGMVAMAAEYRTKNKPGTSPREAVMDAKSAIRWIRAHASELGIDPQRIVAGGGSAGGHLAAAAGTVAGFNEPGENLSVSCVPAALVLFNPVLDNSPGGFGHEQCKAYWKDISPLYNIHVQTPPTVVFLGTADELVPVTSAQKFQSEMQALGLRCDLFLYKGQPHGFFNKAKYRETMVEADRFLNSLGLLQGSPTL
jgi:acetyl esterase